ncbi:prepilin peptidase [Agilicoccus flavus]|uniref:prepilin peptidase n=1 Tax=Agilicoccus flavus TaxID=2775968 RepID=UPI001CF60B1F|nr:A24 family peptidase [Agilicoccus flavus]
MDGGTWAGALLAGAAGTAVGYRVAGPIGAGAHLLAGESRRRRAPGPVIAAATALAWAAVAVRSDRPWLSDVADSPPARLVLLAGLLTLTALLVALAAVDVETHRLPRALTRPALAGAAAWVGLLLATGGLGVGDALRCAGGGLALRVTYRLWRALSPGGTAVGLGDVELAGVLGLVLGVRGWGAVATGAYLGVLLAGGVAGFLLLTRRVGRHDALPHGPFMIAGFGLALLGPG